VWGVLGILGKAGAGHVWVMQYLPGVGVAMLLFLDVIIAPIAKMTLQAWTPTRSQGCSADQYLRITPVTSSWFDFVFAHQGICTNCTLPPTTSLCPQFCGLATVSFLAIDPVLRYGADVRATSSYTFYLNAGVLIVILPVSYACLIRISTCYLRTCPVHGATIEQKWTHLTRRISNPIKSAFCNYRLDHIYWMVLKHYLKTGSDSPD
jgi:hypothetical protein